MKQKTLEKHVKCIGVTDTGKPIMGGAFFMHDTVGLPLGECIRTARKRGAVVSIPAFVLDATRAGWPLDRIVNEVRGELRMIGESEDLIQLVLQKIGQIEAHVKRMEARR